MKVPRPLLLLILDGWGEGREYEGNAIKAADTPVMDSLVRKYSHTFLDASGKAVGLPEGQMGNSEVGHLNIGAGRLVRQDLERINHSIETGDFLNNPQLISAVKHAVENNGTLHLMGLFSDGGVHSHIQHLFALLDMARGLGLKKVVTHAFLDGRDVPPRCAEIFVKMLEEREPDGFGKIATIEGRYYAMDRDNRWDRVKLAYDSIVKGEGPGSLTAIEAIGVSYFDGIDDEFLVPRVIGDYSGMKKEDSVIFYNFRPDRARQLTSSLVKMDFDEFDRGKEVLLPFIVTMTEYDEAFDVPVAFSPELISNVLADVLADNGKTQLHIAETEKYAHVTYFFNGGVEDEKKGEDRVLIPSPKVATYDMKPEMSAFEVAQEAVRRVESGRYDFIVLNFANCDMVGHSGIMEAAVKAVEAVDQCVGLVLDAVLNSGGAAFVTADHGNAEWMSEGEDCCTAHSLSPVPFISVLQVTRELRSGGRLSDIAPTVLDVMDIRQPGEMTGESLLLPFAGKGQ